MKGADKKPIKEYLTLDEESEYMVAFHTKSRSDGIGTQILYKSILFRARLTFPHRSKGVTFL